MADQDAKLNVKAVSDAIAQVGREGLETQGDVDRTSLVELASQAPIVKMVDAVLLEAVRRRSSDIHIEAFEHEIYIRYRIDGRCYQVAKPPKSLALAISSRLKVLANLDVAESRLPQDGRILLEVDSRQIDLRISVLPTMHGESIVLRILDRASVDPDLGRLGMYAELEAQLEQLIKRPHGLVLVTGPTGAGKTTTLYACLAKLNEPGVKLITTEDPVEYDIDGLVQVAVNEKIKLDFAVCLRSILRHDPDVVMVGEIRDQQTAQIAHQAALTGHLVLSTLHTNDAPGAVTRLLDMGIEPFLITSTVTGILAQRLVRRLCPDCKTEYNPSADELAALKLTVGDVTQPFMKAVGCSNCQDLGFKGRSGIYELFVVSESIRPLIIEHASASQIRVQARSEGMRTLREDGVSKVKEGVTTVAEVLQETQDYE